MTAKDTSSYFQNEVSGNFASEQEIKRMSWIQEELHVNKACLGNFQELTVGTSHFLLLAAAWYSILVGYFQNKFQVVVFKNV